MHILQQEKLKELQESLKAKEDQIARLSFEFNEYKVQVEKLLKGKVSEANKKIQSLAA